MTAQNISSEWNSILKITRRVLRGKGTRTGSKCETNKEKQPGATEEKQQAQQQTWPHLLKLFWDVGSPKALSSILDLGSAKKRRCACEYWERSLSPSSPLRDILMSLWLINKKKFPLPLAFWQALHADSCHPFQLLCVWHVIKSSDFCDNFVWTKSHWNSIIVFNASGAGLYFSPIIRLGPFFHMIGRFGIQIIHSWCRSNLLTSFGSYLHSTLLWGDEMRNLVFNTKYPDELRTTVKELLAVAPFVC